MKKISTFVFLFIAISICKPNFLKAQVNMQDSLALVDLYNSTDGPHWRENSNWLSKKPLSKWAGVTVTGSRVSGLDLRTYDKEGLITSNRLSGAIPSSIGNLTKLTFLYLSYNELNGIIPASLGNLINLKVLEINHNSLSNAIPSSLGNLIKLTDLRLDGNLLSGSIPTELGNLTQLTYLNLSFNKLSGEIPSSLGNLTNLTTLEIVSNLLSGTIPKELGNLTKLNIFRLSNNQLTGSIPGKLGDLKNLTFFELAINKLTGKISSNFRNFKNHIRFDFSNNKLSGSIPSLFGKNSTFTYLDLSNNHLSGSIPYALGKLPFYEASLDLSYNQLTGKIPSSLGSNKGFFNLNLSHNQLTGNIPSTFGTAIGIDGRAGKIHFNNNKLSGKIPQSLADGCARLPKGSDVGLFLYSNEFIYAGMLNLVKKSSHLRYFIYAPQANIPIHKNGNILSVYTGGSYQLMLDTFKWYKNGTLVATIIGDSNFIANEDGAYNVAVTNSVATQLTLYSDTINYSASDNLIASKMNRNSSVSLYPNPAKTNAMLSFMADGKYTITLTDLSGKTLQTKTGIANKSSNTVQLNVSNYASGMYLITINDEKNRKQTLRLSKE
jgi:Leucine-rich repeat (LRR) protein